MRLFHVLTGLVNNVNSLVGGGGELIEDDGSDETEPGLAQHIGAQVVSQHLSCPFL